MGLKEYEFTEKIDTRSGFGVGLAEIGDQNEDVVALCADLTGSLKMNTFKDAHPDRFFSNRYCRSQYDRHCCRDDHWR
jgi:transketolase